MRIQMVVLGVFFLAGCLDDGTGNAPPSGDDAARSELRDVDQPGDSQADAASAPDSASSWTPCSCGQPIGSYAGQVAYCNGVDDTTCAGSDAYGWRYQCVELANRFLQIVKHRPHVAANGGQQFCDVARTVGYTVWGPRYLNNRGHKPGAGDVLVWNTDGGSGTGYPGTNPGHVAIVTGSDAGHLYYLQQNWGWHQVLGNKNTQWGQVAQSSTVWHPDRSWFDVPGMDVSSTLHPPVCWVHP